MSWKFWKKDEEDDLAKFEKELGIKAEPVDDRKIEDFFLPKDESSIELRKSYETERTTQIQQQPAPIQQGDIQIISAKLDTIKAMLDLINQRINALERNAEDKPKKLW